MGYDMILTIQIPIDSVSGQPSQYTDSGMKPIDLCSYVVPEEHRKYIRNRGWIFHEYVPESYKEDTSVEADYMARSMPTWDELKQRIPEDWIDIWREEDHDGFKAAMEWFGAMGIYTVTWSY